MKENESPPATAGFRIFKNEKALAETRGPFVCGD
jgi:hypothetical protein